MTRELLIAVAPLVELMRKMDADTVAFLRQDQPEAAARHTDEVLAAIGREDSSVCLTSGNLHSPMVVTIGNLRQIVRVYEKAYEENYPDEPGVNREIASNAIRLPCPSCGARNVFLTHTVRNLDARKHVECRICGMHGPIRTLDDEAVAAWNDLPRGSVTELRRALRSLVDKIDSAIMVEHDLPNSHLADEYQAALIALHNNPAD